MYIHLLLVIFAHFRIKFDMQSLIIICSKDCNTWLTNNVTCNVCSVQLQIRCIMVFCIIIIKWAYQRNCCAFTNSSTCAQWYHFNCSDISHLYFCQRLWYAHSVSKNTSSHLFLTSIVLNTCPLFYTPLFTLIMYL